MKLFQIINYIFPRLLLLSINKIIAFKYKIRNLMSMNINNEKYEKVCSLMNKIENINNIKTKRAIYAVIGKF